MLSEIIVDKSFGIKVKRNCNLPTEGATAVQERLINIFIRQGIGRMAPKIYKDRIKFYNVLKYYLYKNII